MYTLISRFFHSLHRWPRTVVLISLVITAVASYYASRLKVRFSLTDVLPDNFISVQMLESVEKKFGGLGKLTLIIQSEEPERNKSVVRFLTAQLSRHPDVNILDYMKEVDFFEANKLLYIDLKDLQEVEQRVETEFWATRKKYNPILIDLLEEGEKDKVKTEAATFQDLERKYFPELRKYLGTEDEKILIMNIFPRFDISNIKQCKSFYQDVRTAVRQVKDLEKVQIHYTGEVMESLQEEGRLLSEVMDSGWLSLATILLILLVFFMRVPAGPLLAIIPLAMGIVWTMALTYFFIGYLNLITLSLGIILLGLGLDASLHMLSRYGEERRKKLSAEIAFETIMLETGPAVTTGALTSAAAFLAVTVTDFKGFSEFGLIAGTGMACTLVAMLLVFPCLLMLAEPLKLTAVFGPRIYNHKQFFKTPYKPWKIHAILLAAVTLLLCHRGVQHKFEYNFNKLGFPNPNLLADSLLQLSGEAIASPTVVLCPSQTEATRVAEYMRQYKTQDTLTPTIHSVMTLTDLLPADQEQKLAILTSLKRMVTPKIIRESEEPLASNLIKLKNAWDVRPLTTADLPLTYRKKFLGRDARPGNFTFIFPSADLDHGLNCMAFADDTRVIRPDSSSAYYTSGIAVIYADLLNIMIPDTLTAALLSLLTVFILVILDTRSFKATLVLFTPILIGILWTLGAMQLMRIKISYFNLVVFPAMIGIGIDNCVHLYHRYLEEGAGSLFFVMKRTGTIIIVTSLTSIAGFFGLAFSSHKGLYSMGLTAITGIVLTLLASWLFVPAVLGFYDVGFYSNDPEAGSS